MRRTPPPLSERYCQRCKKNTMFNYTPVLKHSTCVICGGTWATRPIKNGDKK